MTARLDIALAASSPRFDPPPTPARSLLIHGAVALLWAALFARAFWGGGVFGWSAGLVYVGYDTALLAFIFWQTLGLRPDPAPPAQEGGARPTLAVVIAARDEAAVLPTTLAALFAQTEPPDMVVVADDGSADGTAAMLAARYGLGAPGLGGMSGPAAEQPSLRWLRLPHGGKARALNAALERIGADVFMTVDADTVLEPDACAAMRGAFAADPKLVAATGVITPVCDRSAWGRLFQWFQTYEYIRNFLSRRAWMRADGLLLISGAFAGFRTRAVADAGGFDAACLVEDYELIHRLRRWSSLRGLGWRTAVLGGARARTDAPARPGQFLRQRRRWFGGFLQTQFWYRDEVGNPRFGAVGTRMLPVKAIDTLQPVYGLLAAALVIVYALRGQGVIGPVFSVIGAKIVLDLSFHLWSVHLYRRWTGARVPFLPAVLAALAEPFSFQILRHLGASWGWLAFLGGGGRWGVQTRRALVAAHGAAD